MRLDSLLFIDLAVIALYFMSVVYVGLRFGKREETLEGFALGGRSIPWLAVLASIIAAETSAATFLGTPGEGFELVNYAYARWLADRQQFLRNHADAVHYIRHYRWCQLLSESEEHTYFRLHDLGGTFRFYLHDSCDARKNPLPQQSYSPMSSPD